MALISVIRNVFLSTSRFGSSSSSTKLVCPLSVNLQKYSTINSSLRHVRRMTTTSVAAEFQNISPEQDSKLSKMPSIMTPPICKGMTSLDKSCFDKSIQVPTVTLQGTNIFDVLNMLKLYRLKAVKLKSVQQESGNENTKIIYLDPDMMAEVDLEEFINTLKGKARDPSVIKSIKLEPLQLTYDNWSFDQIFESILPDDNVKLNSYSMIGHLVHVNLKEHLLPYQKVIGQVLLDKLPKVKTVVNKISSIDNTFRFFQMEILAGEPNTVVTVKHANCQFDFDFAQVYWNPRLSTEHERIYTRLKVGDTLYDVFAGVGPFSVPAGKRKIRTFANDLNPSSFKWLQHNVKKNKVGNCVQTFNQDGRDFITHVIKKDLQEQIEGGQIHHSMFHVTMNLPAMAVEFLDAFWNLLEGQTIPSDLTVMIHVYCFIKSDQGLTDQKEKALSLVKEKIDFDLQQPSHVQEIFLVRNVAPYKDMFRISFRLPHEILTQRNPNEGTKCLKRKFSDINQDESAD